jgi:hypothetical protein
MVLFMLKSAVANIVVFTEELLFQVDRSNISQDMKEVLIIDQVTMFTLPDIVMDQVCHEFKLPALKVKIFQLNDQTDEDKFIRDEGSVSVIIVQVEVLGPKLE